jgi:hypothetical protein
VDRLAAIERAAEIAEKTGDDALMARAVRALGDELARRDPLVRSMLDLDAELQRLAAEALVARERAEVER